MEILLPSSCVQEVKGIDWRRGDGGKVELLIVIFPGNLRFREGRIENSRKREMADEEKGETEKLARGRRTGMNRLSYHGGSNLFSFDSLSLFSTSYFLDSLPYLHSITHVYLTAHLQAPGHLHETAYHHSTHIPSLLEFPSSTHHSPPPSLLRFFTLLLFRFLHSSIPSPQPIPLPYKAFAYLYYSLPSQ